MSNLTTEVDIGPVIMREALSTYPTGVCVVTSSCDGVLSGMTIGTFTSVSLDPPLVGFLPIRASTSWEKIHAAKSFGVNVLAADQVDISNRFAAPGDDNFVGADYSLTENGTPMINGCVAFFECDLYSVSDAGDHLFAMGLVKRADTGGEKNPLIFLSRSNGQFASK